MQAVSLRVRGRNSGAWPCRETPPTAMPPARSAFGGASVTRTVRSLCSRNPAACVMARQSGYSTNQHLGFRVRQQLQVLGGGELVIERNDHAARKKYGVGRNQPLGLIGHDDRGAVPGGKACIFERGRQRLGGFAELPVGQARALAFAVGFDQADFIRPAVEGIAQRRAERFVLRQVEHQNSHRGTETQRKT